MQFNSLTYGLFLPLVFVIYWALPHKFRWFVLLVSSYYFYMSWNVKYVTLILFTTVVSYTAARLIETSESTREKKAILVISLVICLGVLFVFKYFNFFAGNIAALAQAVSIPLHPITLKLMLPVGISFYTFQTLSYVIDVYKGDIEAERHFGKYATFVSFFPQLVAGPIERSTNLLPQIDSEKTFNYDEATYGMKLMAWGFFKKICIADVLAVYVDKVYSAELQYFTGFGLAIAVFCFTIQIYCDFSGYSDIAIGTAKLLGINLMTNFKSPYFSASVREFWSRWHISLSTWFRDYVYIPLGGSRCSKLRSSMNLLITFLVSGLWHGASWNFVAWGGIHGAAQVVETGVLGKQRPSKDHNVVWWIRTILVFAFCNLAWVFFRADNFQDAIYVLTHVFSGMRHPRTYLIEGFNQFRWYMTGRMTSYIVPIIMLAIFDYISLKRDCIKWISGWKPVFRWLAYVSLVTFIIWLAPIDDASQFIYFQF